MREREGQGKRKRDRRRRRGIEFRMWDEGWMRRKRGKSGARRRVREREGDKKDARGCERGER